MNTQTRFFGIVAYLQVQVTTFADFYIENGTSGYFDRNSGAIADSCWGALVQYDPIFRSMGAVLRTLARKCFLDTFAEAYYASYGIPSIGGRN